MDDFLNTDAAEGAVCEDCGEKLSPDATFCPNCGSRRTSKPGIADTELPFQYVMPRIQNDSYTSVDSEESYSFDGGEEEYASDEYEAEEYVADLFGGEYYGDEYSDYAQAMNLPPESAERPSQTRRHAKKRSLRADASEDDRLDPESKKAAICVTVAAGFIAIVLIVSFLGFIVSLFSGNGAVQTVSEDNPKTSSDVSSVASSSSTADKQTDKPSVHLLTEDVKNDSYVKFTLEQNKFTTAMASSYISAKLTHGSTELAFDGDPETSWQDGVKGYGAGEWLLAYNSDGSAVKVSEVTIYNGYQNPKFNTAKKDMYLVNSRVSDFTLTFDDGSTESFTLEDTKEPQTFRFKARETCYVRFTVVDAYKGTKYKDTCVGEIIYK